MEDERAIRLREIANSLYQTMDVDPADAVARARALEPDEYIDQTDIDMIAGSVLVDGGSDLEDSTIIAEGVQLLRSLREEFPESLDIMYNLANGLSALAKLKRTHSGQWHLDTTDLRREARQHFEHVGAASVDYELRAKAKVNHANLLYQSYRWLEAYELYREAARIDPENALASSGAAKVLLRAADRGLGSRKLQESLAVRYLRQAHSHKGALVEYAGPRGMKALEELPEHLETQLQWPPDLSDTDEFTRFVGENHLALSLTIEGLNPDLRRWDSLLIRSISEQIDAEYGVPPIFAMFNMLKADYLAARWLAYQSICDQAPESGLYSDTLDYAAYGIRESLLLLAQRSVIDILDRIAVAASEYLELEGSPTSIYFWKRWHVKAGRGLKQPLEWQSAIRKEVNRGNTALIALSEMAEDIAAGGCLEPQRTVRNASTHRFVVLHDLGLMNLRESDLVEHRDLRDFRVQTISALRLVRAALIYFVEMIAIHEILLEQDGEMTVSLEVPPHHRVRGEQG